MSRNGTRASRPQAMVDLYRWETDCKSREKGRHEFALVGSETVSSVKVLDTPNALLVEGLCVGCCVEIEVTSLPYYQPFVHSQATRG